VWALVSAQLLPLRMPLFFLVSGLSYFDAVRWEVFGKSRDAAQRLLHP
jgi:uncharacterized membrane protein YcfT